jgi:hypothetical protein
MLEDLLKDLPPYFGDQKEPEFLHLSPCLDPSGWVAYYAKIGSNQALHNFNATGKTPLEAIKKLKENIDLMELFK